MPRRPSRTPTATYRLQLRQGVDLATARASIPELARLGVSHLYLSPPFAAVEGSTHGYDVVDPNAVDPSLGTEADVRALADEAHAAGLGILLDVVPNHQAADPSNPAWADLLRRGRRSPHARTFDVDLDAAGGRVVLPVLGPPLEEELASGALRVDRARDALVYRDGLALPLSAGTELGRGALGERALRSLLEEQHWLLVPWREGYRRNYRRFFDIDGLVGVRQEDPEVFRRTHELVAAWVRDGVIDGLRVDHVDGLRDPAGYLRRLRREVRAPWVLVEKILAPDEELPPYWAADGTTGYEFAVALNDLDVDPRGWRTLRRSATSFRGGAQPGYDEIRARSRRLVLERSFAGELEALTSLLERFAAGDARPPTREALRRALSETTAELDVYRTYVRGAPVEGLDRRRIVGALGRARTGLDAHGRRGLAVVRRALLLEAEGRTQRRLALEIAARWQQLTGPVAAKGEEDTALYRDVVLVARNEVGGDPGLPPASAEEVHRRVTRLGRRWPRTLVAGSTHDTKRGEDTRARIDVLSELADVWTEEVERWSAINAAGRRRVDGREAPSSAEELLLYQTLVGAWPNRGGPTDAFVDRIARYLEKALREAKVHSAWVEPDAAYEDAVIGFARRALSDPAFLERFVPFVGRVAFHGAVSSLSQVVLRMVVPGAPDVYQGSEGWNLSLVDPDNRDPVDLRAMHRRLDGLERIEGPTELLGRWRDGDVKRWVTRCALRLRRDEPAPFAEDGTYRPVPATGRHARRVVAVARRGGGRWVLAVVPRFTVGLVEAATWPLGEVWGRTAIALPARAPRRWTDAFTGAIVGISAGSLPVREALRRFPVALLSAE
jgi:(1->4)-alpha-D-glucan 1-alpha-D-glucosylmutase